MPIGTAGTVAADAAAAAAAAAATVAATAPADAGFCGEDCLARGSAAAPVLSLSPRENSRSLTLFSDNSPYLRRSSSRLACRLLACAADSTRCRSSSSCALRYTAMGTESTTAALAWSCSRSSREVLRAMATRNSVLDATRSERRALFCRSRTESRSVSSVSLSEPLDRSCSRPSTWFMRNCSFPSRSRRDSVSCS